MLSLAWIYLCYRTSSLRLAISFLTLTFSEWYSDICSCIYLISDSLSSIASLLAFLSYSKTLLTVFSTAFSYSSFYWSKSLCKAVLESISRRSLSYSRTISSLASCKRLSVSSRRRSRSFRRLEDCSWSSRSFDSYSQSCLVSLS
jgi:hypothetical protein